MKKSLLLLLLLLLLDFLCFMLSVFLGLFLRTFGYDYAFFILNFKTLIPSFFLSVIILWMFSFYDFNYIHKKLFEYKNIIFAFVLNFLLSAGLIYFTSSLFKTATPKTGLFVILLIYFVFVLGRKNLVRNQKSKAHDSPRSTLCFDCCGVVLQHGKTDVFQYLFPDRIFPRRDDFCIVYPVLFLLHACTYYADSLQKIY